MRLEHLAPHLRAAGLTVVEHLGWKSRGYRGRDLSAVRGVIWHHTATSGTAPGDYPTAEFITTGAPTAPLAQIGLGRTGSVHLLAAGLCNHAGRGVWAGLRGNADTIGVEMESPGDGTWTDAQRQAMPVLGAVLSRCYDVPAALHIGHREWAPARKIDPAGIDLRDLRRDIAHLLLDTPAPTPITEEFDMAALDVIGTVDGGIYVAAPGVFRRVSGSQWALLRRHGYGEPASRINDAERDSLRSLYLSASSAVMDAVDDGTEAVIDTVLGLPAATVDALRDRLGSGS